MFDAAEPLVRIQSGPGRLFAQPGNPGRSGVIGGKGEQGLVEGIDRGVREVAVAKETQVLGAGVDVVLEGRDVRDADVGISGGGRQHLHDPDRTGCAARRLIEPRLLIGERGQHQVVEVILFTVLPEDADHAFEAVSVLAGERVARPARALEVAVEDDVCKQCSLLVSADEGVDIFGELRAVLAEGPPDLPTGAHRQILVDPDVVEDPGPEHGLVAVDDGRRQQAGIDHLQEVLVLEELLRRHQPNRLQASRPEVVVELLEAPPVAGGTPHVDLPAREIVQRARPVRGRPGDHQLADVAQQRVREVDPFEPALRDREVGGRDVAETALEGRQQLVPLYRDDQDPDLERPGSELLIQELLELGERLVRDAALGGAVEEVLAQGVDHQRADPTPLDHAVQIANPLLVEPELGIEALELLGTLGVRLGRRIPGSRCCVTAPDGGQQQHHETSGPSPCGLHESPPVPKDRGSIQAYLGNILTTPPQRASPVFN